MKRLKNILTAIICISLLFSNVVFADDTVYTDGALLYVIEDDGNITIVEYFGREDTVEVPMAIGEHFVTSIGPKAFADSDVKSVDLPDTITSIASNAFDDISSVSIKYYDPSKKYVEKENPIIEVKPQEKDPIEEPKEEKEENQKEETKEDNKKSENVIDVEINDIQLDNENIFDENDVVHDETYTTDEVDPTINVDEQSSNQTYSVETKVVSNYSFNIYGYIAIVVTFVCVFIIIKKRKKS